MGHRALLAYRREHGYDLHRSHWGGADFELARGISAAAPYAGDAGPAVDPDPLETGLSFDAVVSEHLDFLGYEAFFRVAPDFETTPFHVLWFGLETDSDRVADSPTVGHGALVEARPPGDDYLPGWFRGAKSVVGDAVDCGSVAPAAAVDYLADRVESVAGDREVMLPDRAPGPL